MVSFYVTVWTRLAANVSQACECSSLTFNWQYSSTYPTQSITWQWASLSTADVIANFAPAPELGFVAYGLFKNRLQFTPTASLTVTSLTLTDPGVLVISILFYANLDFILPSSAVLSSVTPLGRWHNFVFFLQLNLIYFLLLVSFLLCRFVSHC